MPGCGVEASQSFRCLDERKPRQQMRRFSEGASPSGGEEEEDAVVPFLSVLRNARRPFSPPSHLSGGSDGGGMNTAKTAASFSDGDACVGGVPSSCHASTGGAAKKARVRSASTTACITSDGSPSGTSTTYSSSSCSSTTSAPLFTSSPSPMCDACPCCADVCALGPANCPPCAAKELRAAASSSSRSASRWNKRQPTFTWCQIRRHNTADDCWIVARGIVYDATPWLDLNRHPGGNACIVNKAGTDVTADFDFHQGCGRALWERLRVGKVVRCAKDPAPKPWFKFW